jgi:hypothetical protein
MLHNYRSNKSKNQAKMNKAFSKVFSNVFGEFFDPFNASDCSEDIPNSQKENTIKTPVGGWWVAYNVALTLSGSSRRGRPFAVAIERRALFEKTKNIKRQYVFGHVTELTPELKSLMD